MGFAAVGAFAKLPAAKPVVIVYVPGPMRTSRESLPEKLNPVIIVSVTPAVSNAALFAHVVPSAAPALVVEKYRITSAISSLGDQKLKCNLRHPGCSSDVVRKNISRRDGG